MKLDLVETLDLYEIDALHRFNSRIKISDSGCWEWTAAKSKGYGRIYYKNGLIGAHQFSYCHFVGSISDGMYILHSCDNPACCNPSHLFIGTQRDNIHDAMKKGKMKFNESHCVGEKNPKSKLKATDINVIRKLFVPYKMSCSKIAELYNVDTTTIQRIVYRKTWKHIQEDL